MTQRDTSTISRTQIDVREPAMFRVIYINDEHTSMEFVVGSLVDHFAYTEEAAAKIALDIHNAGAAVVAVLPYEIAEQKGIEITMSARANGYPLQIKLEPDSV